MSFAKAERTLNEVTNYNPPPGYYSSEPLKINEALLQQQLNPSFPREQRFKQKVQKASNPGPGHYYNQKDTKKRILEEYRIKQEKNNSIKINSIPSIPKQSSSRIYEELAPGILVLHEAEEQNNALGPGAYEPKVISKRVPAARINPEHKKKFIDVIPENELEQAASFYEKQIEESKKAYSKQIFKKSPLVNVNQNDLCLELIILRQKQLKPASVPPPGYYHNEKQYSSFQIEQKPIDIQYLSGKMQRFEPIAQTEVGPGKYEIDQVNSKKIGGFIPKQSRKDIIVQERKIPGPGAYKIQQKQYEPKQTKSKYPPIFGSGCTRFNYEVKEHQPGPGSYNVDKSKRRKRPKTINLRNVQLAKKKQQQNEQQKDLMISPEYQTSNSFVVTKGSRQKARNINSSFFSSNIRRFGEEKPNEVGPGKYELTQSSTKKTFNKRGTLLQNGQRFNQKPVRTRIGPGYYQVKDEITRQKKVYDIELK